MRQMKSGIFENNHKAEKCAIVAKIQLILLEYLKRQLKAFMP